ncbi:hypothetical protein HAX54_011016, partial [Datura stramonium]|nr:hypothetical protein [Datura stramonium]
VVLEFWHPPKHPQPSEHYPSGHSPLDVQDKDATYPICIQNQKICKRGNSGQTGAYQSPRTQLSSEDLYPPDGQHL